MNSEGERIRELRKSMGLTLEEFAKPLGVTRATMSRIETGSINVSSMMRAFICEKYNVSEEWLKNGEGLPRPIDFDEEFEKIIKKHNLDKDEARLIKQFIELDSATRKKMLEQLQVFVGLLKSKEDH